jgi:hypothetical protein
VSETESESQTVIEQLPNIENPVLTSEKSEMGPRESEQGIPWLKDLRRTNRPEAVTEPKAQTFSSETVPLQQEEEKPASIVEWINKKWSDFLRFWRR